MSYIGTPKAAEKWDVSPQTVAKWCREGRIPGAVQDKAGSPWHIPEDAQPPKSKRN